MARFKDLTGQKIGRLTVLYRSIEFVTPDGRKRFKYRCRCDCGREVDIIAASLLNKRSRSCGCLQRDYARLGNVNRKHSMTGTRLHRIWKGMHTRCYNKNSKKYYRYGGRGIKVCDEWNGENGFKNFHDWAIKNGYSDTLSIDRINNDGDYSPQNCKWSTMKEQQRNRSTNRYIEYNGEKKALAEWCEIIGCKYLKLAYKSDEIVLEEIKKFYKESD